MKKWLLLALLFAGCKKEGHKNNTIPEINIHVLETGTSTQVSGAAVVLMRCNYGCPLGPNVLFTSVTDNAGLVQMPSENYNDPTSFFNITKPKYWNFAVQKRTTMFLTPEGWLQLRLHQAGRYPAGSRLVLNIVDQSGTQMDLTEYNTATDSIVLIRGYGGQQNKIDWQVVDAGFNLLSNGTLANLPLPRLDTLQNITLDY